MENDTKIYVTTVKCGHPSYGIIIRPRGLDPETLKQQSPWYELRCYECDKALPFFIYTEKEWERRFDNEAE